MDNLTMYVRVKCMTCLGKGGRYCPYCDLDGRNFIEATEKTIKAWITDMDSEEKSKIRSLLFEEE